MHFKFKILNSLVLLKRSNKYVLVVAFNYKYEDTCTVYIHTYKQKRSKALQPKLNLIKFLSVCMADIYTYAMKPCKIMYYYSYLFEFIKI